MLRIKLVKSTIGNNKRNRATVAALGLRKMHQSVDHKDTPSIRGMIHHVKHMLVVTEIKESEGRLNTYKLKPAAIKSSNGAAKKPATAVKPVETVAMAEPVAKKKTAPKKLEEAPKTKKTVARSNAPSKKKVVEK